MAAVTTEEVKARDDENEAKRHLAERFVDFVKQVRARVLTSEGGTEDEAYQRMEEFLMGNSKLYQLIQLTERLADVLTVFAQTRKPVAEVKEAVPPIAAIMAVAMEKLGLDTITMGDESQANIYKKEIDVLMTYLGFKLGQYYITDKSDMSDFDDVEDARFIAASDLLGIPIEAKEESVVDCAKRLRDKYGDKLPGPPPWKGDGLSDGEESDYDEIDAILAAEPAV